MNERLPTEKPTGKATPLDLAKAVLRRNSEAKVKEPETIAKAGDVVERDGVTYMYVPSLRSSKKIVDGRYVDARVPHTYRQYYSHSFEDPRTGRWESAPGWDSRLRLRDGEVARRHHGRVFSEEELRDLPNNLPQDDALFLRPMDSYEVEEYLETLN